MPALVWIARLVLVLLALYAVSLILPWALWVLQVLSPFLVALVLAYILDPIVTAVQRRLRLGRTGGIVLLALLTLAVVVGVLTVAVPILISQIVAMVEGISAAAPEVIARAQRFLTEDLGLELEPGTMAMLDQWGLSQSKLMAYAATFAGGAFGFVTHAVTGMIWLGATMALVFVIALYLLVDFDRVSPMIDRAIPPEHREHFWKLGGRVHRELSGFLRGQLTICLCVGILVTVGLLMVGPRQYALLIGVTAGAVNFIPYLGPAVGAAPAVLWALLTPDIAESGARAMQVVMTLSVFLVVQSIDGWFLSPFIVGRGARMHPVLVMLALIIGARGGLGGMIIAVPGMIIARALFLDLVWEPLTRRYEKSEAQASPGET